MRPHGHGATSEPHHRIDPGITNSVTQAPDGERGGRSREILTVADKTRRSTFVQEQRDFLIRDLVSSLRQVDGQIERLGGALEVLLAQTGQTTDHQQAPGRAVPTCRKAAYGRAPDPRLSAAGAGLGSFTRTRCSGSSTPWPGLRDQFPERTWKEYLDFEPFLRASSGRSNRPRFWTTTQNRASSTLEGCYAHN